MITSPCLTVVLALLGCESAPEQPMTGTPVNRMCPIMDEPVEMLAR